MYMPSTGEMSDNEDAAHQMAHQIYIPQHTHFTHYTHTQHLDSVHSKKTSTMKWTTMFSLGELTINHIVQESENVPARQTRSKSVHKVTHLAEMSRYSSVGVQRDVIMRLHPINTQLVPVKPT